MKKSIHILVTGFAPFVGRTLKSSWVAAKTIAKSFSDVDLDILELPVVWGAPESLLGTKCKKRTPAIIVSLGEGKPGLFQIETVAGNLRMQRKDNNAGLPPSPKIKADGPANHFSSAPYQQLFQQLAAKYPVGLSADAGGFLCEETLYTLEELRLAYGDLKMTLFVHLPPYGTILNDGETRCDDELLSAFAHDLIDSTLGIYPDYLPALAGNTAVS